MTQLQTPPLMSDPQPYTGKSSGSGHELDFTSTIIMIFVISMVLLMLFTGGLILIGNNLDKQVRSDLESAVAQVHEVLEENPDYDFSRTSGPTGGEVLTTGGSRPNEIILDENHVITTSPGVGIMIVKKEEGYEVSAWHEKARTYKDTSSALYYSMATGKYSDDGE